MFDKLRDILPYVKWGNISKDYFCKSRTWIYQRLGGYEVNDKPAEFKADEIESLREALHDIARRIDAVADNL